MSELILKTNSLIKYFESTKGFFGGDKTLVKAVDGIDVEIYKGETVGLVGESGCGKTTAGRTITKLYEPTSGSIIFDGEEISNLNQRQMKPLRSKLQMIFQDPYSSLNPRKTIGDIISAPIEIHKINKSVSRKAQVQESPSGSPEP